MHRNCNLPPSSALTEKDRKDPDHGLTLGVAWIGLSFVERPEYLVEIEGLVQGRVGIAKLESRVTDVPEITKFACQSALKEGFARTDQTIAISAGKPFDTPGTTNLLRIGRIN